MSMPANHDPPAKQFPPLSCKAQEHPDVDVQEDWAYMSIQVSPPELSAVYNASLSMQTLRLDTCLLHLPATHC